MQRGLIVESNVRQDRIKAGMIVSVKIMLTITGKLHSGVNERVSARFS